jgi:1,4-dihydroxy-2-naphthoate octaprenyltransferase
MKIEINNQTSATIGVVFTLLIIEFLMSVFKVNYIINISIDIVLCIFFNIYNYKRFRHFQTKEDLQLANKRLAFASLFMNLPFVIGIIAILNTLH